MGAGRLVCTAFSITLLLLCHCLATGQSEGLATGRLEDSLGTGGLILLADQLPKRASITGFELHISSASYLTMSPFPARWHVSVDNTSKESVLEAHANPGGSPMSEAAFRNLELEINIQDDTEKKFDVWGSFKVLTTEAQKNSLLPVSSWSFRFVQRSPRVPLPLNR